MVGLQGKKVLFIIAPRNFRDEELFDTKAVLENSGATATIASKHTGEATGAMGGKAYATLSLERANASDFDAVVFVGGAGAAEYFDDPSVREIAKSFASQEKVVAAICIAPTILANAGLLQAKRATCFSSQTERLREKGCSYTGNPVEVDGKIVTASGPEAAKRFGEEIAQMLTQAD